MKNRSFITIFLTILLLKLSCELKSSYKSDLEEISLKQVRIIDKKINVIKKIINNYLSNISVLDYHGNTPLNMIEADAAFKKITKELGYGQISITYTFDSSHKPDIPGWKKVDSYFPYMINFYNGYIEQYCNGNLIQTHTF